MTYQPEWVNNLRLLQEAIHRIIAKVIDPSHIVPLLDDVAMRNYWVPAFTHRNVDATSNYEKLEFYGDKVVNYAFTSYIRKRFNDNIDPKEGTLLLNQYMSKDYQANLSRKLGLVDLVRYNPADPDNPNINVSVQEDIFESFLGALSTLVDDRIQPGLGYVYVFNLISDIFNEVEVLRAEKDPVTQLKELYEKLGWGTLRYDHENSDYPGRGRRKAIIRNIMGEIIGVGYGKTNAAANSDAAANALNLLAQQGFTAEHAEKEKLRRSRENPEFNRQYERLEKAIEKLKADAAARGKYKIVQFELKQTEARGTREGVVYTWAIRVAFEVSKDRIEWRTLLSRSGNDPETTKIELMKSFADQYRIP